MASKVFFVFCAATIFLQSISAQCVGSTLAADELAFGGHAFAYGPGYGAAPFGAYGPGAAGYGATPTSGGGFTVTSVSPIAPTGINVVSENAIEGTLSVIGELPFLGAIALEGALPTAGAGGINYGCGNGAVGIVSEGIAPAYGPAPAAAVAPGRFGYGAPGFAAQGLAAPGIGAPGFGYNGLSGYGGNY